MHDKNIIAIEVEDKPGVMSRISSLFSRRNFNVESLTVGRTHKKGISRFTVVVEGDNASVEQIKKQCQKLVNVITTEELTYADTIMREFLIVKLQKEPSKQKDLNKFMNDSRSTILNENEHQIIIEITGSEEEINIILSQLDQFEILELIRTGKVGILK